MEVVVTDLNKPNNNEKTDEIKEKIQKLSESEKQSLIKNLEDIIEQNLINSKEEVSLEKDGEKFCIIENAIYYLGRIGIKPNIELLKKVYSQTENFYIKQNITFTLLPYYVEEVELDFANKVLENPEYQQKVRSWTIAFFYCKENPYNYVDNGKDDCEKVKNARINRFKLNKETDEKIEKAKSFRLLDLVVMYLFQESRGKDFLTSEEKEIVANTKIDWEEYSEQKKNMMLELKNKIAVVDRKENSRDSEGER